jgi:hypothetical protein
MPERLALMNQLDSPYAILQVDPAAEPEIIESAYRRLARKYHPDVNGSRESGTRMRAINRAYALLSDPRMRAIHNQQTRRAWTIQRLSGRPLHSAELGVRQYRVAVEPVLAEAAVALQRWASHWTDRLESLLCGDVGSGRQIAEASQCCLWELTDCLARWEAHVPPASAARLGQLGGICLRLMLTVVRAALVCAEEAESSILSPLARLADRIASLGRTIAAELAWLDYQQPEPNS